MKSWNFCRFSQAFSPEQETPSALEPLWWQLRDTRIPQIWVPATMKRASSAFQHGVLHGRLTRETKKGKENRQTKHKTNKQKKGKEKKMKVKHGFCMFLPCFWHLKSLKPMALLVPQPLVTQPSCETELRWLHCARLLEALNGRDIRWMISIEVV